MSIFKKNSTSNPPVYFELVDQSNRPDFKANPTLANGDIKISLDGGAYNNIASLPTVSPAGGTQVEAILSQAEWNADLVKIICSDVADDEWDDFSVGVYTQDLASEVWDEVLTGATHNIATSAGRRLRGIQEFQGYEEGAIWVDTENGSSGTTDFENGTVENPVDNMADANTLALSLGISTFHIDSGSTITLAAAQNNQLFIGDNWTLELNGQDVAGTKFIGAIVSGVMAGTGTTQIFENCFIGTISLIKNTHLDICAISGTVTVVEVGDFFLDRCHSAIAGTDTWTFDFGTSIGNTNLNVRRYSGGIQVEAMGNTGTDTMSLEGNGQFIEGTCTAGVVTIRGHFTLSGITNLTLSDDARYDATEIANRMLGLMGENVKWSGMIFDSNNNMTAATITEYTDNTLVTPVKSWTVAATYNANSELLTYQLIDV